jgi:predicted RNA-binding protein
MTDFWVIPTNSEAWTLVKEHNLYAFHRESDRDKIKSGDKAIFYVVRSTPPVVVGAFESEIEFPINDMRLDVAWRMPARQNPDHAWEVHIGGNFFEALAKLKHAWDLWKADPYLVTTEHYEEETRKLLGGTFHEIKQHIRIVNWKDVVKLYKLLRDATAIEKEMKLQQTKFLRNPKEVSSSETEALFGLAT